MTPAAPARKATLLLLVLLPGLLYAGLATWHHLLPSGTDRSESSRTTFSNVPSPSIATVQTSAGFRISIVRSAVELAFDIGVVPGNQATRHWMVSHRPRSANCNAPTAACER
ncbi:hypothetical protein [Peristeroidobacter soli]|uniref:hypothetical protein n=1 Tax=Peristeroidobacter soli TaxID=2497877 RepID=UPI0013008D18|nr:hypothetical protein [Peristeroidobacter soli]